MLSAAKKQSADFVSFHAGTPTYDKDTGGTGEYHWAESIFQKPNKQAPQREYRFALVGSYKMIETQFVELKLGPCDDIISIIKRKKCEHCVSH